MPEAVSYVGKDLEAMSFAVNYHRWILDEFRPHLGKNLVEVGAGTGSFTELLLEQRPRTLAAIEPSGMYDLLVENIAKFRTEATVNAYQAIFTQVASKIKETDNPDSIIYVNVLEHIEDDAQELKAVYETLAPKGRMFIFVPALPALYGAFDREVGHFRRYVKSDLETKVRDARFKILKSSYFDFAGIVPWWIKYQVFKASTLDQGTIKLYDKYAVPITRAIESAINPPLGKNILLIAAKD
jgi:SAM-dependent methyltransferase